jgi:tRNA(Arg) A34 adenosine deaminase TadA
VDDGEQKYFMKEALMMACSPAIQRYTADFEIQGEKALAIGETPVGCVLVHEGKIIGAGMNDTNRSMNVSVAGRHNFFVCMLRQLIITERRESYLHIRPGLIWSSVGHETC